MKDRVVGVLPTLVDQAVLVGAMIFDKAVAIGVARSVDPAQRRFDVGPKLAQRLDVAGVLGVEASQHDEQRCRVHTSVIQFERNLPQRGHLTATHLVQDFSGLSVGEGIGFFGLIGGQPPQHAFGDAGITPQHLHRRDDPVAAKRGRVPRDAGVRIRTLRRRGRQDREVRHRAAHHLVEDRIRGGDGGHATACGPVLLECGAQALAEWWREIFVGALVAFDRHID